MKTAIMTSIAAAMLSASGLAGAESRAGSKSDPWMYRETAVFNHVVGDARFVGNFLAGPQRCDVTVFETRADDNALRLPLRRFVLPIAAGGRSTIDVGPNAALAIVCAPAADAIGIEAEMTPPAEKLRDRR